ncbi:MAG: hypothetical protein ACMUIU_10500 [bacterium]
MYHFIRRFFIFVLVLAFGFSFLLCCFVHSGRCQLATDSVNVLQSVSRFPPIDFRPPDIYNQLNTPFGNFDEGFYAAPLPIWMNSPTWGALKLSDLSYLLPIAIGQSLFRGSTSSIIDRTGLQLGTTMQYSPSNFGSQLYTISAYDRVGYGFPFSSPVTVNYSLPSSSPSFLTTWTGGSLSYLNKPPVRYGLSSDIGDIYDFGVGTITGIGGCSGWMMCDYF